MRTTELLQRGLLIVGFLLLAAATLTAHFNPATSYELSIYTETPITVWLGVCFSLFIALGLAFTRKDIIQRLALFLAGSSFMVVVMLPLLRGYYHLGEGDTMSHAGWVKDISTGLINPIDIGYPAVHLLVLFVTEILNTPIPQALYYVTYAFIALFVIFLPLTVRLITTNAISVPISVFAATLLLPVNLISVHMNIHPTSQAILFTILMLYIFSSYIKSNDHRYVIIFPIVSLTLLFLHPQQAANFLLLLGTAGVIQILAGLLQKDSLPGKTPIYIQTSVFVIAFWIWFESSRFIGNFVGFVTDLLVASEPSAQEVGQRSTSLADIGSGPEELFVKLFLVSFIFCLIAAGYILSTLISTFLQNQESNNDVILYITAGLFPISFLFLMYIVASVTTQYFRHLGFIMVLITVLGSLGFGHFTQRFSPNETISRTVVVVLFAVFLSLSLMVVYPSPYMYQGTEHVSEGQIDGYETAFTYQNEERDFLFLRSNIGRFDDFYSGTTTSSVGGVETPDHFADQDLANHYNESKYLVVTSNDRQLDANVYNGFRYSREDFQYVETHPTISQVHTTGDFDLYVVEVQNEAEANQ